MLTTVSSPTGNRCVQYAFAVLACVLVALAPSRSHADFSEYKIDPAHFAVSFLVKHIGYANTLGMFLEGQGNFMFDEDAAAVKDIVVTITADSVFTNHDRRDGHLKGKDFLNAKEHPEVRFVGTDAKATGETTGTITGDLTLLGVTKPMTLDVTLNKVGDYPFGRRTATRGRCFSARQRKAQRLRHVLCRRQRLGRRRG